MSYDSPYENVPRSSSETTAIALVVFMAVLRGLQILLTSCWSSTWSATS